MYHLREYQVLVLELLHHLKSHMSFLILLVLVSQGKRHYRAVLIEVYRLGVSPSLPLGLHSHADVLRFVSVVPLEGLFALHSDLFGLVR